MKLTDCFPADVKPVHIGPYRTKDKEDRPGEKWFQWWGGKYWGSTCDSARAAEESVFFKGSFQNVQWKGVAEKPE